MEILKAFTISNEELLQHQLKEYSEATLKNILNEIGINECFNIDKGVAVTDSEILDKVLHADQNEDEEIEGDTEERISNSRCIQLTEV